MPFTLQSSYQPSGDQPQAIDKLVAGLCRGHNKQTLLGVTGSGKTFTIANCIAQTQLPTLVISHNKTLAGQLYQEFKELFPHNKVSYFVSYYDYYQPEAYIPSTDTYISKEVEINDLIDRLRLEATSNLFSGKDNIVVASVSCIYNIGDPVEFSGRTISFEIGQSWPRRQLLESLVSLYYSRVEVDFKRSTFRLRGETLQIWPSSSDQIITLDFDQETLKSITQEHPLKGSRTSLDRFMLYPAKQYVGAAGSDLKTIFKRIRSDLDKQVEYFRSQNRLLEAQRISQRVNYDLEMIQEMGYVNGIENYSIYFESNRKTGDPPFTLVDYFRHLWGDNYLTIIDESHVTVPQIGGMYQGDLSRKKTLIDFGFRLPAALDNRPLKWEEFYARMPKAIYVSATPSEFEIKDSRNRVIEQVIRPTGLVDPPIDIRPESGQIPDLIKEVKLRIKKRQRTLAVTLTKRMAEDLAAYLSDINNTGTKIRVAYLHADIDTLERGTILDDLRSGKYDVLVGVNLLREGLDLPEVSLVAILDAGQQGFLRSRSSLIQIMGRASRNVSGKVILYSDIVSTAMKGAIGEVNRRRRLQLEYNRQHGITPQSIVKSIRPQIVTLIPDPKKDKKLDLEIDPLSLTPPQRKNFLTSLKKEMRSLAADMNFEAAIEIRDKIRKIENT